jgi:nucleoside-diphosphate-sugar epimerase
MKILVVGGQGFIGQALVARLRSGARIGGRAASLITVLDQQLSESDRAAILGGNAARLLDLPPDRLPPRAPG